MDWAARGGRSARAAGLVLLGLAATSAPASAGGDHHKMKFELVQGYIVGAAQPQYVPVPVPVPYPVNTPTAQPSAQGMLGAQAPAVAAPAPQASLFNTLAAPQAQAVSTPQLTVATPQPAVQAVQLQVQSAPVQAVQLQAAPIQQVVQAVQLQAVQAAPVQMVQMPAVQAVAVQPVQMVQAVQAVQAAPAATLTPVQLLIPRQHCLFGGHR
jgi:hypothetical protein